MIERLTVADERAARVVRERAEAGQAPPETVSKAVEIGARVLDSEETAANVDYVRAELERQGSALGQRLMKALEEGDEALAERIALKFDADRDGSVQKEIEATVAEALDAQREGLLKLFTSEDGRNPLFDYKDAMVKVFKELGKRQQAEGEANRKRIEELTREIIELREGEEADRRVAEEAERGTAKGRSFEELVHETIEAVAAAHGDAAHHTGDESSESGGKKGDTVVEIGAATGSGLATVVFEAKNKKLSKNDAWTELNGCMSERDADLRRARRRRRGQGPLRPRGADRVPGQQDHRRARPRGAGPARAAARLPLRASAGAGGERERPRGRRGRRARRRRRGGARLKRANRVRKSLTSVTNSADTARAGFDEMVAEVERASRGSSRWWRRQPPSRPNSRYGSSSSFCEVSRSGPTASCAGFASDVSPALTSYSPSTSSALRLPTPPGAISPLSASSSGVGPTRVRLTGSPDWFETVITASPAPNSAGDIRTLLSSTFAVTSIGAGGRGSFSKSSAPQPAAHRSRENAPTSAARRRPEERTTLLELMPPQP